MWNAVYVKSRTEAKVIEKLELVGIECYSPLKKEKRRWSDRVKTVLKSILPGYVFVNIDSQAERLETLKVPNVVSFVRNLGKDAEISDDEINILKTIIEKGYYVESTESRFTVNDLVTVLEGPFKGFKAKVLRVKNNKMAMLLFIDGINQCIKVKMPLEVLKVES